MGLLVHPQWRRFDSSLIDDNQRGITQSRRAFAWLGDEGDAFNGTGTPWIFERRPS